MSNWILIDGTMINLNHVVTIYKGERRGKELIAFEFSVEDSERVNGGPYYIEKYWPCERSRDRSWAAIRKATDVIDCTFG